MLNILFIYSLISIWLILIYHIVLAFAGYQYRDEVNEYSGKFDVLHKTPFVSIIVPAHNEEKVIEQTVKAILNMDYPTESFELIVVNDKSTDRTGEILYSLQENNPDLKIVNVRKGGGRGKSAALNIGLKRARGDYIVVYDADNTPEKLALKYLVSAITENSGLACVVGKFRTRNKYKTILTRFINLETLGFQWLSQAGRWKLFKISTIPGTNYIIRKNILDTLGGWDENSITEDTELSMRIYQHKGVNKIKFFPLAITWEQEPETLSVWFKQRTRWVKGNIQVISKLFSKNIFSYNSAIILDLIYYFSLYFLFISAIIVSDSILILQLFGFAKVTLSGYYIALWILAFILFLLEMMLAIGLEKGENNYKNLLLLSLMYFTYSQLWIVLVLKSSFSLLRERISGDLSVYWYKTERF